MKTNVPVIVAALLFLTLPSSSAFAQGTAFTYQGQLQNNGSPASGGYDLQFTLYATNAGGVAVAGPVTNLDVQVSNGLFTTMIDFGPGVFTGASNWLDIAVETNALGPFTELTPRQQLMPVPYAQFAEGANAGRLSGTLNLSVPEITTGGGILLFASNNVGNFFVGPSAGNPTGAAQPPGDSGSFNTAVGDQALCYIQTGSENTANGYDALFDATSGSDNTADGFEALGFVGSGQNNTAVGVSALGTANGDQNTAVGTYALQGLRGGAYNIALGYDAGSALQGSENANIDIGNNGVAGENDIIRIGTPGTQTAAYIAGNLYVSGAVFSNGVDVVSDRNAKERFRPLDACAVLAKVAALPITEWNYKTSQNLEHIGPMAQDFHAAFGLNGPDDKHISVVDEGGVALAAIQGLNEKLEADNAALKQENNSLAKRLDELEAEVKALSRTRQ